MLTPRLEVRHRPFFFLVFSLELFGLRRGKWVSPQHPREAGDGWKTNMYVSSGLMG